ncbi:hypothetical protein KAW48_05570 [candidate division WOR-3 bacterium]|nr:hypothetical protein [candidate division WOR-3 bacterium]
MEIDFLTTKNSVNPLPYRREFDDIIFDKLGLTEEEKKEIYCATAELVQQYCKG